MNPLPFLLQIEIISTKNNLLRFFNQLKSIIVTDTSKHESIVESLLQKNGFTRTEQKIKKTNIVYNKIDNKCIIPNNHYIKQPFGTQQNPDFIIKHGDRLFAIECKSSKSNFPLYNSGGIHPEYFYIFTRSQKPNTKSDTTFYQGSDIYSQTMYSIDVEYYAKIKEITDEYNKRLIIKDNKVNYYHYPRDMVNTGINYFSHPERSTWEKNVLLSIINK
jgi:hypothetical protein